MFMDRKTNKFVSLGSVFNKHLPIGFNKTTPRLEPDELTSIKVSSYSYFLNIKYVVVNLRN